MILDIVRPRTVREAVRARSAPWAAYLGGGTWLNSGRAEGTTRLISLEHLALASVDATNGRCTIGAMVTLQRMIDTPLVPAGIRAAAALTASRTLRNMKTLGGDLGLRADDSALIPVLIALEAVVNVADQRKPLAIEDFLAGPRERLVLSVVIPDIARAAVVRAVSRTSHSRRSVVVAVAGGAAPPAERLLIVVSDCSGNRLRLTQPGPVSGMAADMHASAEYKRYIAGVLVADALAELRP